MIFTRRRKRIIILSNLFLFCVFKIFIKLSRVDKMAFKFFNIGDFFLRKKLSCITIQKMLYSCYDMG